MDKILKYVKEDKIIHYIIIVAVSLIAAIPLISLRIYGTDDGFIHLLRIIGTDNTIKDGIFPPLIQTRYARGFGYAMNLFYGPIVTYGPLLFKTFCTHYYDCLKLFAFATIIISGFTMYNFLCEITKKREIAVIGAIIYILIPYRLETIYNRFAIGEFSAYMFFPMLFHGLYNVINSDGKKNHYIIISAAGLILTHTISTEYSAIFAALYLICHIRKLKNKEIWRKLIIDVVLILLVTSFYTIPIVEHKINGNYIIFNSTSMRSLPEDVQNSALSPIQLVKDTIEPEGVDFNIGMPLIIFSIIGIVVASKISDDYKDEYLNFILIAIISLFMSMKLFPWIIMPQILTKLQFAWRMLSFFEFALSIICAINLYTLIILISNNKEKLKTILVSLTIILVLISMSKVNYNYKYESAKTLEDKQYEKIRINEKRLSIWSVNREYLPANCDYDYIENRKLGTLVLSGEAEICDENENGLSLEFNVKNAKEGTIVELPYIYYLGYSANMNDNGENKKIDTFESENGFVAIKIGEDIENAHIKIMYSGTILEKAGYVISAVSILGIACFEIFNKRKSK